jgi:hypothetical protein
MVIRTQEKIDDNILYQVKQIMSNVYSITVQMKESEMKKDVLDFFNKKKEFLTNLKIKYSGKTFAGSGSIPAIYTDIDAITKTSDTATIFGEIIARKDSLEDNADILEQLEAFYKEGSSQKKVYDDALEIVRWYDDNNSLFGGLEELAPVISEMSEILNMTVPFAKMTQLNNLVFQANEVKDKILETKFQNALRSINADRDEIKKELDAAVSSDISEKKKTKIKDKYDEIERTYTNWGNNLTKKTNNLDSYVVSSQKTVTGFKEFIQKVLVEAEAVPAVGGEVTPPVTPVLKRKTVRVVDCVPTAKKKIKSQADIDSVVAYIKAELEKALHDSDEIDLN